MKAIARATLIAGLTFTTAATAETKGALKNKHPTILTENGITLKLGGEGHGYVGSLKLTNDGRGTGSAKTDSGRTINIDGTWAVKGDQFCRTWKDLDDGKEVCETWISTSPRSVDVYKGDQKLGVNSW
ncbi:hypothetical protein [Roseobacter sinensis]|uniref:Uncharacterized protein n=1 Tax=Roseobacter sinensis TaxID=2931391 RepID=A0ABT3BD61_9RHOB|nr:hypothetical protein [Roseobacter sp. WL0113]MCV3271515.1 hypothetical protein [Roseobacter sp. WL0113]